ncbi:MBL fold metallo-hydrolase [Anaerococcus sp. Marseille-P3625]|uniref:MBL fold metallo-hydrolase n=1 Tax=Anaerococcus sp. Marseille-P3625 TaxID=1977277 RepID=UPI000C08B10B|nr:MBL fold metallo-hydrolase [Anaerococcus sp. Marseille-P3625]
MDKFAILSSGSSGNCIFLEYKKTKILIDAGFSAKKIEYLLGEIGKSPKELDAIFVTHEHADHSKGLGTLSRKHNLPIFANQGTWKGLFNKCGKLKEENIRLFESNKFLSFGSMDIYPIKIHHDANEPVGFIIYIGNKKITILTDTGIVDDKMAYEIKGSDIYYMEANHDLEALKRGPYPYPLKLRVMGNMGHLSNDQSAEALADALEGKNEKVFLGHLSETNNTPELSRLTVDNYLRSLGLDTDKDILLDVADRYKPSGIVEL